MQIDFINQHLKKKKAPHKEGKVTIAYSYLVISKMRLLTEVAVYVALRTVVLRVAEDHLSIVVLNQFTH